MPFFFSRFVYVLGTIHWSVGPLRCRHARTGKAEQPEEDRQARHGEGHAWDGDAAGSRLAAADGAACRHSPSREGAHGGEDCGECGGEGELGMGAGGGNGRGDGGHIGEGERDRSAVPDTLSPASDRC